jgi:hypothetical protein
VLYGRPGQPLEKKFDVAHRGSSWYFKAGCYLQSHVDVVPGEDPQACGEVLMYDLKAKHE